ncbi:MAG: hypothetical protein ACC642_00335 [Pseudomonadales bacterium]
MEKLLMLTDNPWLSALIWSVLLMTGLYLGRDSARKAIMAFARLLRGSLRLIARGLTNTREVLAARNREVLLVQGREVKERLVSREFERITATVNRDLTSYPETQRLLTETIQRIDEDHQTATDVPPEVPGWSRAVEAVAKVSTKADPTIRHVLEAIHASLAKAEAQSLTAYRSASKERHRLLSRMRPAWQTIQRTLKQTDRAVNSILERSRSIDRHMDEYEEIVRGSDRALHMLSTSSLVQFSIATLVVLIAVGGAFINFSLIARPMAEMVGGTSYIGQYQIADIAALVIILVEMSMGLFLMESLRITRLFPVISALPERTRITMVCVSLTLLTILASVEAGLAYMREVLLQDELATASVLRGAEASLLAAESMWITTAAQMGMGFILPFALTFVAIPLETFIQTARHVIGLFAMGVLNLLVLTLRVLGNLAWQAGNLLLHLYDLIIFAPLWIEGRTQVRRARREAAAKQAEFVEPDHDDRHRTGATRNRDEATISTGFGYGETPA